jgi:hypothetical protein
MKDVGGCRKPRGAANQALIRGYPNGATRLDKLQAFLSEYIGQEGQRRELKHLSSVRKRKRSDSLSSGERNGNSQKLMLCKQPRVAV